MQNKNFNLEIEPVISREPLQPPNNEVTHDVLLTTVQRRQLERQRQSDQMGVERHRPIRVNIQVV